MRSIQQSSAIILSLVFILCSGCSPKQDTTGGSASPVSDSKQGTPPTSKQGTAPSGAANNRKEITVWRPDGRFTSQLADAKDVGGYLVRPPKGYEDTAIPGNLPAGTRNTMWGGARREDGSVAVLSVLVMTPPPEARHPDLGQFMTQMLEGVKKRRQNWSQSEAEIGTVSGVTFMRKRWRGTDGDGRQMQGVMYAAIDGGTYIQLQTQDLDVYYGQTLKLTETAILTFQKK